MCYETENEEGSVRVCMDNANVSMNTCVNKEVTLSASLNVSMSMSVNLSVTIIMLISKGKI